jgi:protoporphyrinogen oxidase
LQVRRLGQNRQAAFRIDEGKFLVQITKTLVIGAGPTGLATAYALNEEAIVLESQSAVGGLCCSFEIKDAVFDIGGHSFHTTSDEIQSFICDQLGVELFFQKRDAKILFKGSLIPYPWQRYFHLIKDSSVVDDCYSGLKAKTNNAAPANLRDMILVKYGEGIAKHFLFPYNRKLWQCNLEDISCGWTSERIVHHEKELARQDSTSLERKPLDENSMVGYPLHGGFDRIFTNMASKINKIYFNRRVCHIDPCRKTLVTQCGDQFKWETIVSTMPVPELVAMIKDVPSHLVGLAEKLPYVSLQVDFFVTGQPLKSVPQRLYCADSDMPAHKIAFNSLSSPAQRNKAHHSIMAETSIDYDNRGNSQEKSRRILDVLIAAGLLKDRSCIIEHQCRHVKYAYPLQGHDVAGIMNVLSGYLENLGIYSVGRFGKWEYINCDQCLLRGRRLAGQLNPGLSDLLRKTICRP